MPARLVVAVALIAALGLAGSVPEAATAAPAATRHATEIIPAAPRGAVTIQVPPLTATDTSGIPGVLAWNTTARNPDRTTSPFALSHDHVKGPVTYTITPPVGGPHNVVWMNAGVYTKPVPAERAVHDLEHGAVWITYSPDLPRAQAAALTAFVTRQTLIPEPQKQTHTTGQANRYLDLSPWSSAALPSPIVISSWGHQLRLTSPDDPRLQQFVDVFRHSRTYTPEYGAPVDGVGVQTGGRPALDGSVKPNPPGAKPAN